MSKVLAWVLSLTKLGKVVAPVQKYLSGKKVYLSSAAVAIPALLSILQGFSDMGVPYLMQLPSQPEYRLLMEAIAAMGIRAAITKAADPAKDPNARAAV